MEDILLLDGRLLPAEPFLELELELLLVRMMMLFEAPVEEALLRLLQLPFLSTSSNTNLGCGGGGGGGSPEAENEVSSILEEFAVDAAAVPGPETLFSCCLDVLGGGGGGGRGGIGIKGPSDIPKASDIRLTLALMLLVTNVVEKSTMAESAEARCWLDL